MLFKKNYDNINIFVWILKKIMAIIELIITTVIYSNKFHEKIIFVAIVIFYFELKFVAGILI